MKHSFIYWVVFVLLAIWQLPQVLVALIMMPFLGKLKLVADGHYNLCYVGENMSGGISLGNFAYISNSIYLHNNFKQNTAHEFNGHARQSKILGPLYLLVIGLPSILNAAFGFTKNYYDFYTEKWANKIAGLTYMEKYPDWLVFTSGEAITEMEKYLV